MLFTCSSYGAAVGGLGARRAPGRRLAISLSVASTSLADPALRRLLLAWTAATAGEALAVVGFGVYAYRAGGAAAVGLLGVVQMVAAAVFGPPSSLLGDRYRRERVLAGAAALAALSLTAATAAAAAGAPPAVVFVLAALLAVATGVTYPASTALVPLLARSVGAVTAATATCGLLRSVSALVAPVVAGLVLLAAPGTAVLAVAAVGYLAAAVLAMRLPRTDLVRSPPAISGPWLAMIAGFRAAGGDRHTALVLGALAGHGVARGALGTLLVVLPLELLDLDDSGVGLLLAVLGVGGLIGALGAATLAGRRRLAGPMGLGMALAALPLLLAAALPATTVVLVAVVVVGAGFSLVSVVGTSLLVRAVRDDVLSRVLGVLQTVRAASMAVGAGVTPLLLGAFGLRWTLAVTGAGLALVLLAVRGGLREIDASSTVPARQLALLSGAPVFAPLPPVALERLASRLEEVAVTAGSAAVQEGDEAQDVYLVASGELAVEAAEAGGTVDRIVPGEVFGEMALLHGARRNATVRAVTDCVLYRLTREEFLVAVTGSPESTVRAQDLVATRLDHRRRVVDGLG